MAEQEAIAIERYVSVAVFSIWPVPRLCNNKE
jgi:hypothetical protein